MVTINATCLKPILHLFLQVYTVSTGFRVADNTSNVM